MDYSKLDLFTKGYIEALFFTEGSEEGDELYGDVGIYDFAPATLAQIIEDCTTFQQDHSDLLAEAYEQDSYDVDRAGNDFWYTRQGQGVGYWDRGLGEVGKELTEACGWGTKYQEVHMYVGDDGKIHH